jgi:hypothetical protein
LEIFIFCGQHSPGANLTLGGGGGQHKRGPIQFQGNVEPNGIDPNAYKMDSCLSERLGGEFDAALQNPNRDVLAWVKYSSPRDEVGFGKRNQMKQLKGGKL